MAKKIDNIDKSSPEQKGQYRPTLGERDSSFMYKEHLILSQQWIWYNHYDNFAQMHLMIATVSEVSDVADGTLVDFLAHLSPSFQMRIQVYLNEGSCPSPKRDNSKVEKLY